MLRAAFLCLLLAGCSGTGARNEGAAGGESDLLKVRDAAEASYAAKNYAESEKHYTLLAQKVPLEADNWFRLGNIYARTNRPDAAIAAYREALVRAPENSKAWLNMAIVQLNAAADSLMEMQKSVPPADPLGNRGAELRKQILMLIQSGATHADPVAAPPGD